VVATFEPSSGSDTGVLTLVDAKTLSPTTTMRMQMGTTKPWRLLLHPDGRNAYVDLENGDMRIFDLTQGAEVFAAGYGPNGPAAGPAFEIESALRFPYAPNRVIGGQSDNGNNVNGDFVDISMGGQMPAKITLSANGDVGSITDMATPFGQRL
jgi:hypothetical protein